MRPQIILAAFLVLLCSPVIVLGQASATGAINGTVTDPSGLAIAGAKVTLLNEATNIQTAVNTNEEGQYRILNVVPSLYNLTVEALGFKTTHIGTFRINVNQTLTQDIVLQVGEISQNLEVTAQGELLQRTTVELGTVVQEK